MRFRRIILLVLDGCGVGVQEDYSHYQPVKTNTIGNVYKSSPGFRLPFLESLGLGEILGLRDRHDQSVRSFYGKMRERTAGNDTFAGVWEMFGVVFKKRFHSNLKRLPPALVKKIAKECGISVICNEYISGYKALDLFFPEHKKTGLPILYLSDDGVILLAAHKDVMSPGRLNLIAQKIQKVISNQGFVRIITRPFYGEPGGFIRNERARKDFLLLDINDSNLVANLVKMRIKIRITKHLNRVFGYPKGVSVLKENYQDNKELIRLIERDTKKNFSLQVYVVPDTDNLGHKKEAKKFGLALKRVDSWLKKYTKTLKSDDLLLVTGDHGCDPTAPMRGHCREFVPILAFSKSFIKGGKLGTRNTFSDIGQTIGNNFNLVGLDIGKSFEIFR